MSTSTVEDYVKQLYLEQRTAEGEMILMGRLATAMGVVPGTATSMVKSLAAAGLAEYQPRGGVRLSDKGEQLALGVLRRHRLVELFLVRVLGLDWSEVHEEAEALEHAISDRVLERLDAFLGRPTTDPHGDPIPSAAGVVAEVSGASLAECPVGDEMVVARVLDQSPLFLQLIERQGLVPGAAIVVRTREVAAEAVAVRTADGAEIPLGLSAAKKIVVVPKVQAPKNS